MIKINKIKRFFAVAFAGAFALIGAIFAAPIPQKITPKAENTTITYQVSLPWVFPMLNQMSGKTAMLSYPVSIAVSLGASPALSVSLGLQNVFVPVSAAAPSTPNLPASVLENYSGSSSALVTSNNFYVWSEDLSGLSSASLLTAYGCAPAMSSGRVIYVSFSLYFSDNITVSFFIKPNVYYLLPYYSESGSVPVLPQLHFRYVASADTYESGYQNGYNEGYDIGQNAGYNEGKTDGKAEGITQGKVDGYNTGYAEGVAAAGDYTFFSLISAVIDAPITAFSALFNFEILGMNMRSFVLSLLTAVVLVSVVRFFMGHVG